MSRTGPSTPRSFHEIPLILFTSLGIAGAGVGWTHLLRVALQGGSLALSMGEGILISALLFLGLVLSAGHVGRPLRGPMVVKGVGRSPLSNEVLALSLALAASGGSVLLLFLGQGSKVPWGDILFPTLGLLTSVASLAFLLALGLLYRLPGRPNWIGPVVFHPLVTGTGWGLVVRLGLEPMAGGSGGAVVALLGLVLLLDGGLLVLRAISLPGALEMGEPVYPRYQSMSGRLHGFRLLLSLGAAPVCLLAGWWWPSVAAYSLAILLDRVAFYALVVERSTESEIRRVEALL